MTAKEMLEEGRRHIANNMTDEEENIAYKLFEDALPLSLNDCRICFQR